MDLKTCYEALGGNYQQAMERLRSERLVQKFVLRYLDEGSYDALMRAVAEKNGEEGFRAAHTIKGICLNLSFDRLYASSNEVSEALRHGWTDDVLPHVEQLKRDHAETVAAISALRDSLGG